jgi:hypothetical protein
LSKDATKWSPGPELPFPVRRGVLVKDEASKALLLVGGRHLDVDQVGNTILKISSNDLSAENNQTWTALSGVKLSIPNRENPVVLHVPDNSTQC